jgi:hypothetical protein
MATKRFAPVGGQRRARVFAGLLLPAGLAIWLMPGTVGAQQPLAANFTWQLTRAAEPEARARMDEALKAFERLLVVSRGADAMGSHWQVRQETWRDAQEAWEESSATLPPPVKRLKRCAVPLGAARGMIERADDLFRQAQDRSDPFDAARMLAQHERLLKQAGDALRRAERCSRAVRDDYLKMRDVNGRPHGKTPGGRSRP